MKKFLFCNLLLSFSAFSIAQNIISTTEEYPWANILLGGNGSRFADLTPGTANFILNVSENERVLPIQLNKKEWGVCKVNNTGKQIWRTDLQGEVRGIGRVNSNIIVFTVDDYTIHEITAYVLDGKNGKTLQKNLVYKNGTGLLLEIKIQNKPDGTFNDLLVRTSNLRAGIKTMFSKMVQDELAINKLETLTFTDDLKSKISTLKLSAPVDIFSGSIVNAAGDIFIAAATGDNLFLFGFDREGSEKQKLIAPIDHKGSNISCLPEVDEKNDNKINVAAHYENDRKDPAIKLLSFDFSSKKVTSTEEEVLNHSFGKTLDLEDVKGIKTSGIKDIGTVNPAAILQWEDKILLLQQGVSSYQHTNIANPALNEILPTYYTAMWVLSIYDKDLKLIKNLALDKRFENGIFTGLSLGHHLRGDHLYIVCPAISGSNSYGTLFSNVDLKTETVENKKLEKDDLKKLNFIEGASTLWFDKTMLLQYIVANNKFMASPEIHCLYQNVQY